MEGRHYLLLFAKYPYHGKVKTRLEPALGVDNAQSFAKTALIEVLQYFGRLSEEKTDDSGGVCCRCIWCYAPSSAAEDVHRLLAENKLDKTWQAWPQLDSASDLGHRLAASVKRAAEEVVMPGHTESNIKSGSAGTCTLIGSDCFELTISDMTSSIQVVSRDRCAVMLPASDGGYVLLSLPIPIPIAADSIFDNIRWSSAETAFDQRVQLETQGYHVEIGRTLSDVDEPADLQRMLDLCTGTGGDHLKQVYPRTIAFVEEHMLARPS